MLLKLSKFFLYASVFAVVIVLTATFFPFIGGKYDFFRVAVELSLGCFILWWAFEAPEGALDPMFELWKKPIVIAVTIFAAAFLLASFFALDAHAAFWSNYERGEGGFQMIHYYVFFLLMVTLLRSEKDWRKMFWATLAASFVMIFYGVMSAASPSASVSFPWPFNIFFIGPYTSQPALASSFWGRLFSDIRFQGSLGNPAYVAPYLMFSIFYALWLWLSKEKTMQRTAIYLGIALFFFVFFWLSGTRGALLGLGFAVLLYLAYLVLRQPALRRWAVPVLAGCIAVSGVLITFRHTPLLQSLPGTRLFDIALSDDTVQTRLWTWESAWQGFLDRPIFGWGPENFTAAFDKHFNPKHFIPGSQSETWFDRAHSVVFDYLAETGIVGFLAYIGMLAVFYWEFAKRAWRKKSGGKSAADRNHAYLQALLFVILAGYFVQGLALFDVLPIYIGLFTVLAFASYLFYRAPQEIGFPKMDGAAGAE